MTGNQIAALLAEYLLERRQTAGKLGPQKYVVKTLVTTEIIRRIADAYGVRTLGDLQVGFKYIGGTMDDAGPENFVFGCEESHGYLVGTYARDKDAAVAAMLLAELAAQVKAAGQTLHQKLDALYWQYGCHAEKQVSIAMPGSEGMARIESLMARLRQDPPQQLAGLQVSARARLSELARARAGGQAARFSGAQRGHGDDRPGGPGNVRGRASLRHGAQSEVLHVRLRIGGTDPRPGRREAQLSARIDALAQDLAKCSQPS